MTIRTIPFDDIDAATIARLAELGVPETETLDFKEALPLEKENEKIELLQDIVAMANGVGGTIVYGVKEGDGDLRGVAAAAPGIEVVPEDTQQTVGNLIRDGIDEPLYGVRHRAVALENGRYAYVIRIPASPLAPHQVTLKNARWRYHLRSGTSSNRMTSRQVKQVALRTETGVDIARRAIETRTQAIRERSAITPALDVVRDSALVLHLIPIFPASHVADLADQAVVDRLVRLPPFGQRIPGRLSWSLAGLAHVGGFDSDFDRQWTMLLRTGGLEFVQFRIIEKGPGLRGDAAPYVNAFDVEDDIRAALRHAREHADSDWLSSPFLFSFGLLNVGGVELGAREDYRWRLRTKLLETDVVAEPELVSDWASSLDGAFRRGCDLMWQAWGHRKSPSFSGDEWTRRSSSG